MKDDDLLAPDSVATMLVDKFAADHKTDEEADAVSAVIKKCAGTAIEEFRKDEVIRASGLWRICAREFVLRNSLPLPDSRYVPNNMSMQLRMNVGSYLHAFFQNEVFGPAGILYGSWIPWVLRNDIELNKGEIVEGFYPSDGKWFFIEEELYDPITKVRGHSDGMISVSRCLAAIKGETVLRVLAPDEKLDLWELKTTDDSILRKIKDQGLEAIDDSYKCQATWYQRMKGVDRTLFVYIDRKYFGIQVLIYKGEQRFIDLGLEKAASIWHGIEKKVLPARCADCPFDGAKRAKACMYKTICFTEGIDEVFASL